MEAEYIYVMIGIVAFLIGIFFGVQTVKFFSEELIFKLENSLKSQLAQNETYFEQASKQMINKFDQKIDYIDQINIILSRTQELLSENKTKIKDLNNQCDSRKNLESEIIKLKKIIERMEKKR